MSNSERVQEENRSRADRLILVNVERLHHYMDEAGCAAIIARSGKNFTYLAGVVYPGTLGRHLDFPDTPRDVFCIWPRTGEPIVVTNSAARGVTRRDSWVKRIELIEDYVETGIEGAAKILRELGLDKEKLGFERTYISALRWAEIESALPSARLFDCTVLMDEVRWIKTPAEVDLLRQAADIQDEAYLAVFPGVKEGDTERQVHGRMLEACVAGGCGYVHGILASSRNPDDYSGESDVAFRVGDIIYTDYVSYYRGYPGHQSRLFSLGTPSAEIRKRYRTYHDIYLQLVEFCRPGRKANEVWRFANTKLNNAGFPHQTAEMVGHSVGAWFHQQDPVLVHTEERLIEEGMVIALEPYVGYWHVQDMFYIGKDSNELLSPKFDTRELFVI